METHTLTLTRYTQKYLRGTVPGNPRNHSNVIEENQRDIVTAVNDKSMIVRGWEISDSPTGFGNDASLMSPIDLALHDRGVKVSGLHGHGTTWTWMKRKRMRKVCR